MAYCILGVTQLLDVDGYGGLGIVLRGHDEWCGWWVMVVVVAVVVVGGKTWGGGGG